MATPKCVDEADDVVFHVGHETVLRISARKESKSLNSSE